MQYLSDYSSPLGDMILSGQDKVLTGLWFTNAPNSLPQTAEKYIKQEIPIFYTVKKWLDIYFNKKEPNFMPQILLIGSPFQLSVWKILQTIPYGQTITYGDIAKILAKAQNRPRMSAQAVGGAVGRNKISILIPCHRVVGANGNLTGYAGGMDRKYQLLAYEGINMKQFFIPTKDKRCQRQQ